LANDFIPVFLKQIMTLKNVKSSLPIISNTLQASNASREFLIKNTRDVVILCSHSIIAAHKGDLRLAREKIKKAEAVLKVNQKKAKNNFKKYLITPEQEFVEAHSFLAIVENKEIPSLKSLKVSEESYILGLLDCIGELKRFVLDNIRNDQLKKADRIFNVMENLYQALYPFAMYDKIVKETRRKLDVNRILVEETRAVITEEIRRNHFVKALTKK
jgi:translin